MRVTCHPASRERRRRVLRRARGFRGNRSKLIRQALDNTIRADVMAYRGRKLKKRQFRQLWMVRLNAALRAQGTRYSDFIHGLHQAGVTINRKVLADLAVRDAAGFAALAEKAKAALA